MMNDATGSTTGSGSASLTTDSSITASSITASSITLRNPEIRDGAALHALVAACPPLDLNSCYAYLLIAHHHAATSVVADSGDPCEPLAGAITAYVPPAQADTLFVWQVAVAAQSRGQGLAQRMLQFCFDQSDATWLETTISPDNQASQQLFTRWAERNGAGVTRMPLFSASHFGEGMHEDEHLYRIGPLARESH